MCPQSLTFSVWDWTWPCRTKSPLASSSTTHKTPSLTSKPPLGTLPDEFLSSVSISTSPTQLSPAWYCPFWKSRKSIRSSPPINSRCKLWTPVASFFFNDRSLRLFSWIASIPLFAYAFGLAPILKTFVQSLVLSSLSLAGFAHLNPCILAPLLFSSLYLIKSILYSETVILCFSKR